MWSLKNKEYATGSKIKICIKFSTVFFCIYVPKDDIEDSRNARLSIQRFAIALNHTTNSKAIVLEKELSIVTNILHIYDNGTPCKHIDLVPSIALTYLYITR